MQHSVRAGQQNDSGTRMGIRVGIRRLQNTWTRTGLERTGVGPEGDLGVGGGEVQARR